MGQVCGVGRGLRWKIKQNKSKFLALSMLGSKLFDILSYICHSASQLIRRSVSLLWCYWKQKPICFAFVITALSYKTPRKRYILRKGIWKWNGPGFFRSKVGKKACADRTCKERPAGVIKPVARCLWQNPEPFDLCVLQSFILKSWLQHLGRDAVNSVFNNHLRDLRRVIFGDRWSLLTDIYCWLSMEISEAWIR